LNNRAGGWPHIFADTARVKAKAEKMATLPYYDAANFAKLLKIPGIYAWGYNDLTVPPTASSATYNAITAPKESVIAPEAGHARTREQTARMDAWLLNILGVR
jgi:cephalosporin-C deacetylase-like acetyl esterase